MAVEKKRFYDGDIEQMLLDYGPLGVVVEADDGWINYRSGVYSCPFSILAHDINHSVVIVGYTQDYWIVKNSWGTFWGENGFMRIKRNIFYNCEIGTAIYYLSGTYSDPTDPGEYDD